MILLLFLVFYQIDSLFIVVKEGSVHCILETIPQDVAFMGTLSTAPLQEQLGMTHSYESELLYHQSKQVANHFYTKDWGIRVTVTSPDEEEIIHDRTYPPSDCPIIRPLVFGKFAFQSKVGGDHKICFSTNISDHFFHFKLYLNFEVAVEDSAHTEKVQGAEARVHAMIAQTNVLIQELAYQKRREREFRATTISTNTRASGYSILQIILVILFSLCMLRYIQNFLKKKKIF